MLSLGAWLAEMSKEEFREEIKNMGFNQIEVDEENCNINYSFSENPVFLVQEHTDCNEFVLYGEDNSIEQIFTSTEQLKQLCIEHKIKSP